MLHLNNEGVTFGTKMKPYKQRKQLFWYQAFYYSKKLRDPHTDNKANNKWPLYNNKKNVNILPLHTSQNFECLTHPVFLGL